MATARTTYQDGRGAEGAVPAGHTFVWVSLRDPSPEELASVQHEFALPGPLIDDPHTSANRLDNAVEGYGPVLSALNDAVDEAAQAVFNADRTRPTERLCHLARQVLEFRRAAAPLAEMLDRLATEVPAPTGDRFRRHFRQQRPHLQHLVEGADALGNLLANALQAYLAEVSVRQNTDMRRISAWAAICAVPTLLAGIYGMNFRHMPELSWRFGYPLVLVVMVAMCLGLYRAFRHYGWL